MPLIFRSYATSFLLHGGIFVGYLFLVNNLDVQKSSATVHSMQVSLIELKEQVKNDVPPTPQIVPPKPIEKPKPIVKPKPIEKPKPVQKVVEEPTFIKEEVAVAEVLPTAEAVEEAVSEEVAVSNQPLAEFDSVASNIGAMEQNFIVNNFEIIRQMVLRNLVYPNSAKKLGHIGTVEVSLVIDKKGKLLSYDIVKPSRHKSLNISAKKAVERVRNSQFPKPHAQTTVILPIVFQLT